MFEPNKDIYKKTDVVDFPPRPVEGYPSFTSFPPMPLEQPSGRKVLAMKYVIRKALDWVIVKLGGVPRGRYNVQVRWQSEALLIIKRYEQENRKLEDEIKAQRDRIEQFILRETFGDRDFLTRQKALEELVREKAAEAVRAYFKELDLYEKHPRSEGHTWLLSHLEDKE